MQVRELGSSDLTNHEKEIRQLIKETVVCSFPDNIIPDNYYDETYCHVKGYLEDGKAVVFAAIENDSILGWAWCHPIDRFESHRLHIAFLAVMENARGKGIGHKLMDHVIAYADREGFDGLDLMVTQEDKAAVKLYKDYGFETERLLMRKRKSDDK